MGWNREDDGDGDGNEEHGWDEIEKKMEMAEGRRDDG